MDCALCETRVKKGSQIVMQDDLVFVMVNHAPVKESHLMVLPKRCVADLSGLTQQESKALLDVCEWVMNGLDDSSDETPMCLLNGVGFRTQPQHLHVHILLSRNALRGLYKAAEGTPGRTILPDDELIALADNLRSVLGEK